MFNACCHTCHHPSSFYSSAQHAVLRRLQIGTRRRKCEEENGPEQSTLTASKARLSQAAHSSTTHATRGASSSRLAANSVAEGEAPGPSGQLGGPRVCAPLIVQHRRLVVVVLQSPPPWFRPRRVLGGEGGPCLAGRVDGRPGAQFVFSPGPKTPPDQLPLFAIDRLSRPVSRTAPPGRSIPHTPASVCVPIRHPPLGPDEKGVAQP